MVPCFSNYEKTENQRKANSEKHDTYKICVALCVNFTRLTEVIEEDDDHFMQQLAQFWKIEGYGGFTNCEVSISVEDKRALAVMERSSTMVNGHYQIAEMPSDFYGGQTVTLAKFQWTIVWRYTSWRHILPQLFQFCFKKDSRRQQRRICHYQDC